MLNILIFISAGKDPRAEERYVQKPNLICYSHAWRSYSDFYCLNLFLVYMLILLINQGVLVILDLPQKIKRNPSISLITKRTVEATEERYPFFVIYLSK